MPHDAPYKREGFFYPLPPLIKKTVNSQSTGKRIGILPLLDEELKLPGGSDIKYLSRLLDKQMKNIAMKKTKSRNAFRVQRKCFQLVLVVSTIKIYFIH